MERIYLNDERFFPNPYLINGFAVPGTQDYRDVTGAVTRPTATDADLRGDAETEGG